MPVIILGSDDSSKRILSSIPNLLIPFAGKTFFHRVFEQFSDHFQDFFVFSANSDQIASIIGKTQKNIFINDYEGLHSEFFLEKIKNMNERTLILRDLAYVIDGLESLIEEKHRTDGKLTVMIKDMKDPGNLRQVYISPTGDVDLVMESKSIMGKWVDIGVYSLDSTVLWDYLRKYENKFDEIIERMIREIGCSGRLRGQVGRISDIISILETQRMIMDSSPQIMKDKVIDDLNRAVELSINTPVYIEDTIKIGERSRIGPYVTIMKNSNIGDDVYISNSIIMEDVDIGSGSYIEGAVIGKGSEIPENTELDWGDVYYPSKLKLD